jgi:hypothetical protein
MGMEGVSASIAKYSLKNVRDARVIEYFKEHLQQKTKGNRNGFQH